MAASRAHGAILELPDRSILRRTALIVGVLAAVALGVAAVVLEPAKPGVAPAGQSYPVPRGEDRVIVEVYNGTARERRAGLSRVATRALRREGFDVVATGNASLDSLPRTRVIARRGDIAVARRVAGALGVGVVTAEQDSGRRVDVSVQLGADYRPVGPLHP